MSLTPRENLMRMWRRQGYERAPSFFILCPSLEEEFARRYGAGIDYRDHFEFPFRGVSVAQQPATVDWLQYYPGVTFNPDTKIDYNGVAWESHPGAMHIKRMHHPMKNFTTVAEFEAYPYPKVTDDALSILTAQVEELHGRGLAAAGEPGSLWEESWYMRSMEELMMDMVTGDEKAVWHFNKVAELVTERYILMAKAGVDFIHLGDDIGMQHTIMMSEELYRNWLKPRFAKIIRAAKEIKPDLLCSFHSCGFIEPYIPDLIEIGVDILNPIQPECMSFAKLHGQYGNTISFWGTIGTQSTMPFGTPEEVKAEVKRNLELAGKRGGLLCTPTHMLEPEVPWENIEAYVQACREHC